MNEFLFFFQTLLTLLFVYGALRLGQEALTGWVVIQAMIANLFVIKQITLFGFEVTAGDVYAIGSLLGLNLLQEHYGDAAARKASAASFFLLAFFVLISQVHLFYVPSAHDTSQQAFLTLLSPAPRILGASIATFFIVQQIEMRLFAWLKALLPSLHFSLRSTLTLTASQLIDTVLFSAMALYGSVAAIFDVILLSYAVKLAVIFLVTPLMRWIKI